MRQAVRAGLLVAVIAGALAGVGRSAPGVEAAGPGTWTFAADMSAGFGTTSATLLRDGSVLHAGGYSPDSATISATSYRYFPGSNTWTGTAAHVLPRTLASLSLLQDGRALLAGGTETSIVLSTTELYMPGSNTWVPGPLMPAPQASHEAVKLMDGRVVLLGGQLNISDCLATVQVFDPVANTITAAPSMSTTRSQLGAVLLQDGRVLVAGGGGCFGPVRSSAEIYDPASNSWTTVAPMLTARRQHKMTLLPDGRVLAVGGNATGSFLPPFDAVGSEVYDPATNTWTATGAMNTDRFFHDALLLGNGHVLAAGGYTDGAPAQIASTEMYDPATDTWTPAGALNEARGGPFAMTMLTDGRALAVGGEVNSSTLRATAELWDPTSWRAVAPMGAARLEGSVSLLQDGRVLAVGGLEPNFDPIATSEAYSPSADSWAPSGSMVFGRYGHTATVLPSGIVLIAGGFAASGFEIWNPSTGLFSPGPTPAIDHEGASATLLKDGRVLIFGSPTSATPTLYTPATSSIASGAPAPSARRYHRAVLLNDGRVLMMGGFDFISPGTVQPREPWIYDPVANSWSTAAGGHTAGMTIVGAALLPNGDVLAAGGENAATPDIDPTDAVSIYDADTNTWTAGATLPVAGYGEAVPLYDNTILMAQGSSNFIYRPTPGTLTEAGVADVENRFSFMAARLPSGKVLVAGGADPIAGEIGQVNLYDLGIHTDTDGDGYHDGVELALGQHPWSYCATMRADVNMDGNINSGDQLKMAQNYFSKPPQERVDQDGNLKINAGDQLKLALQIAKSVLLCP